MLVSAVSRRPKHGRKAEVEQTAKNEAVVGLQCETVGGQAPARLGPISAIAAALRLLSHPGTRKSAAAESSAETGMTRRPERDRSAYRSPMETGITGGFSLLMDNPNACRRR